MRKCLSVCTCLIFSSLFFFSQIHAHSRLNEPTQQYADDQILVKYKAGLVADTDVIAEEIVRVPGARTESLNSRRRGGLQLVHLNNSISVDEAVRRANQDPRVEFAEPDYLVHTMETIPDDPIFTQMWGLSEAGCLTCNPGSQTPNIDATRAWDITTGSDDVVVVVLDTGAQLQHEDLAANAWVNPFEIPDNGIDDDGNGFVDDVNGWNFFDGTNRIFRDNGQDFHGTHVSGSIGAVGNNGIGVTGVSWHVKIMSLKFLGGPKGSGPTSNAVRGINYAIDMRRRGVNVRVINASWGGGSDSQSLRQAIQDANNAGILFVCAAGNDGVNIDEEPDFPGGYAADFSNTISVAAVSAGGNLPDFSNFGHRTVSLAAPGVSIWSTIPTSNGKYGTASGTSMSTPYVSGIAALLWSHEPSLTPAQVKQRIVDTSEPIPSLVSLVARSGRASAYNALTNTIPSARAPEVVNVQFTKRSVTVNGFGFVSGSAVIEVDGVQLPNVSYDNSFALANGTLTQLTAEIGKKPLKRTFPVGVAVSIRVINQSTGESSARFTTARF
jgi:subtilisin family serine protease